MVALYGMHPVLEALKKRPRAIKRLVVSRQSKDADIRQVVALAEKNRIPVRHESAAAVQQLAGAAQHQGVAAEAEPFALADVRDVVARVSRQDGRCFLLVLDCVQDPQNFGSLIRSAVCCGVQAVVFARDRAAQLTGSVAKASAGAIEHISLCRVVNIAATLDELRREQVWVAGTVPHAGEPIYTFDLNIDLALVVGGEGKGMRRLVQQKCDFLLTVPMQGAFDSLNASVAGAVVMFEAMRQRMQGDAWNA